MPPFASTTTPSEFVICLGAFEVSLDLSVSYPIDAPAAQDAGAAHQVTLWCWPITQTVPACGYRIVGSNTSRTATGAAATRANSAAMRAKRNVVKEFMIVMVLVNGRLPSTEVLGMMGRTE